MLVAVAGGQGEAADTIPALSYGGRAMTKVVEELGFDTAGFIAPVMSLWILDEDELDLAVGSAFTLPSGAGGVSAGSFRILATCYDGVDQASPTVASNGTSVFDTTANVNSNIDITLTTVADGAVISAIGIDIPGAPGGVTYASPLAELVSEETGSGGVDYSIGGVTPNTGTSVTADLTLTAGDANFRANAHIAASLRPLAAVELSGSIDSVSGSTADLEVGKLLAGSSDSVSGSQANLDHEIRLSGSSDSVSGSTADLRIFILASTNAPSVSSGTANGQTNVLASARGDATAGGTANASEFGGARATGDAVSGGTANAALPVPIVPATPIEDSFANAQRPVFLVDLFFASGEVNIWTRNVEGEFAQKTYQALAGVTSGITIRNSLDTNISNASIEMNGQSEELRSIALTENYRNRRATIILGNRGDDDSIEAVETIFSGFITNMSLNDNDRESTITITLESVFRNAFRQRVVRQSPEDLKRVSPGDSFFDQVGTVAVQEPRFGG
jgi:hypothetical protein